MIPPLIKAARDGDIETINRLLAEGADINVRMPESNYRETRIFTGDTPLIVAAQEARPDVINLLLEKGADVNATNNNDRTALHALAGASASLTKENIISSLNALLKAPGIDIHKRTKTGISAFESALFNQSIPFLEVLKEAGVDINEPNNDGITPLERLIIHMRSEMDIDRGNEWFDSNAYNAFIRSNNSIFANYNNSERDDIKQKRDNARWLIRNGGIVREGKEYLYKNIAGYKEALANATMARRGPALVAHIRGWGKNGGGRRRKTLKKRKTSTTRRRKHRRS